MFISCHGQCIPVSTGHYHGTCSVDSVKCGVAVFVVGFFFVFYILLYNLPFYNFIVLFTAFV